MRRWIWVCALLGVAPVAAQRPPEGYRVRIGPEGSPAEDDPLAPEMAPDEGVDEPDAGVEEAEAAEVEPMAPAAVPEPAPAKPKRSKKARKKRHKRWRTGDTVTPLEAAQRLDETPGEAIEFARALTFRHDSVSLTDDAAAGLAEVVDYLQASPEIRLVLIEGHTDASGSLRYNQALSEARAAAVRKALVGRGVAPERLVAYGYGETRPATPERAANRRVVFRVIEGDRKALVRRVATEWGEAALVELDGAVWIAPSGEMDAGSASADEAPEASPAQVAADEVERPEGAIALRIAPPSSAAGAARAPERPTPRRTAAPEWTAAEARSQLAEGHDIRTGADGRALLRLPDLGRIWLGADTHIRLSKLFHDHATGKTYLSIRVLRGTVRAMLNPLERGISRSLVAVPGGALEAVAADFELAVAPDGTGRLRVDRGRLDAADGGARSRPIYAGQAMRLGDAAARAQLAPPTAVSPLRGRFERAPALVWLPVPDAAGYVVEVAEDVDFHRPVLRAPTQATRFEPRVLAPDSEHYWRVRAIDGHGLLGAASRIHAFRTAPRDETPPAAARADAPGRLRSR